MNSHDDGKSEPADPEKTLRLLELELMQKRTARQQAGKPYRGLRAAALLFLVVVILGALLAFFYVFTSGGLDEMRARKPADTTSPAP